MVAGADRIEVRWPSGAVNVLTEVAAGILEALGRIDATVPIDLTARAIARAVPELVRLLSDP